MIDQHRVPTRQRAAEDDEDDEDAPMGSMTEIDGTVVYRAEPTAPLRGAAG